MAAFGYISNFWINFCVRIDPSTFFNVTHCLISFCFFFRVCVCSLPPFRFPLQCVITRLTRPKRTEIHSKKKYYSGIKFHERMWSYYIIFHSLICCPHLSCRPRLWCISRVQFSLQFIFVRSLHISPSFNMDVFACNFAFHVVLASDQFVRSQSVQLYRFFFSFSYSLDFHKETLIDSKPSTLALTWYSLQKKKKILRADWNWICCKTNRIFSPWESKL